MSDTDATRAQKEMAEIRQAVDAVFHDPASAAPRLVTALSRPRVRIWERPSLTNHRCWAVWERIAADTDRRACSVRRLTWRYDLDGGRSDPMRRLQLLGEKVEPTIEVADGIMERDNVLGCLARFPHEDVHELVQIPLRWMLDGTRFGVEVDAGISSVRVEWPGGSLDWEASDSTFDAISAWALDVCRLVDERLDTRPLRPASPDTSP